MNLKDLPVSGKKVLVRVDFNVPLSKEGKITDDTRIRAAVHTIKYLCKKGAAVILMSHLGRPGGVSTVEYSLYPCAIRLEELLRKPVFLTKDCIGSDAENKVKSLKPGEVLLLENLRFHKAEEKPDLDSEFAEKLASYGDFYINDAFGTAHRAHSSTAVIAQYFPGKRAAGLLLEKEISFLCKHFQEPSHPFYAIIGGAKICSKLGILTFLIEKVDALFIGGGMAYTFFKAKGIPIGDSLCEEDLLPKAKALLKAAESKKVPIFLPKDLVIADAFNPDAQVKTVEIGHGVDPGWQGVDIGPVTCSQWANTLQNSKMIFWNGPLGIFEMNPFAAGTNSIAKTLANLNAITIIGGGDSVAAINNLGIADQFSHISTGGGASLEYIEFGHLPGIDALK
jgi:phosphoglycerate kinase